MEIDPFEEFKKKKEQEQQKTPEVDDSFYEIPKESAGGSIPGLISHRFVDSNASEGAKPQGFEPTKLGDAMKEEAPKSARPQGFESNSLTDAEE